MRLTHVRHRRDRLAAQTVDAPVGAGQRRIRALPLAGDAGAGAHEPIHDEATPVRALHHGAHHQVPLDMHVERRAGLRCLGQVGLLQREVVAFLRDRVGAPGDAFGERRGVRHVGHHPAEEHVLQVDLGQDPVPGQDGG